MNATPKADKKSGGQLRKHYFMDQYVVIAPERAKRPDVFTEPVNTHHEDLGARDIIDEPGIYELRDTDGKWLVKVIPNKFPALSLDTPQAFGKQEVIIDTPQHGKEFSELSLEQIERVFSVYIKRTTALEAIPGIRYVAVFKNDGPKAGASIMHAHSQIIALPLIPPALEAEATAAAKYYNAHGRMVYADLVTWEHHEKVRVVYEDSHLIALCPYASQNPYELWLVPKKFQTNFADLNQIEQHMFAVILKKACAFLDSKNVSFNFFLQSAISPQHQSFVLKVEPRKTVWAGLELDTGVIINPVAPEEAAKEYRAFFKK